MQSKRKPTERVSAEQIARMAERGKDVSDFFTNDGKMVFADSPLECDFASPISQKSSKSSPKRLKSKSKP